MVIADFFEDVEKWMDDAFEGSWVPDIVLTAIGFGVTAVLVFVLGRYIVQQGGPVGLARRVRDAAKRAKQRLDEQGKLTEAELAEMRADWEARKPAQAAR